MKYFICKTCGVQYERSLKEPSKCIICTEERQYVNPNGQAWTTLEKLIEEAKYHNAIQIEEPG